MIERTKPKYSFIWVFLCNVKNKYVNYQTLIKLIKKLLCFVINRCTFVRQ